MAVGFHFKFSTKDAKRLFFTLVIFELVLVLTYLLAPVLQLPQTLQEFFNMNGEANLPSWFSSMQLFLIGIVFLFSKNWYQSHQIISPAFLFVAGLGFVFLSMDEAAVFHENLTGVFENIKWWPRFKGNNGIWITLYFIIAIGFLIAARQTIQSVFKIYPHQTKIMLSGLMIFLSGAVGLEIISYIFLKEDTFIFTIEVAIEEFFEMSGASLILYGCILCALHNPK